MKTEFCIATIDFSRGSAYEFKKGTKAPTIIKYGRYFDSKFKKGEVKGAFDDIDILNIVYLIKRGYTIEEISFSINGAENKKQK